ncbi:aminoacyl-tRNA deacylase [Mycoplana dimorpha]|uniref:Ala-tRNA(Pro) deacylase n=1 Tax=Mycoplana dimorpha TaxID=28320 RepID=A0A2T5B1F6_MYCDI|nr:aminoacyl-tRNA deacylase [Mycoplana dimorpha]PTM92774.1 Ala-tRNA(Pro) deacylase [Mycoplana dimorpha]
MTIARKLQDYIDREGIAYDTVPHHRTATTSQSAQAAHVPGSRLAKTVVVHHEAGYVLAVVPSTHRIELTTLQEVMNRRLGLASEDEVSTLFSDCDEGAAPPVGMAYNVPVIMDESLGNANDVYFEGGDHRTLVHVSGSNFRTLMKDAQIARFSHAS